MCKSYLDQLNDKHKINCPKCGETMKIRTTRTGIPVWESKPDKYEISCFCNNVYHTFGISYNATLAVEQAIENVKKYKQKNGERRTKATLEFEVPESCGVCKLAHPGCYGAVCVVERYHIDIYSNENKRAPFCPLKIVEEDNDESDT